MLCLYFMLGLFVLALIGGVVSLVAAVRSQDPGFTLIAIICGVLLLFLSVGIGTRLDEIDRGKLAAPPVIKPR